MLHSATAWVLSMVAIASTSAAGTGSFDVLNYDVSLTPDMNLRQVSGQLTVTLQGLDHPTSEVRFDAGDLQVSEVRDDGLPLTYTMMDHSVRIVLARPLGVGEVRSILISYHGSPRYGLEFHPEHGEIYTVFSTSQWMPCLDSPDERATLELAIRLPAGMHAVGTGRKLSPRNGDPLYRWRLDVPMPSYLYGFAAGRYNEFSENGDGFMLRYLSTDHSSRELQRIFKDSADILRFFGTRSGIRFHGTYTQALVAKTIGQEMAGVSLLPETYGLQMLEDATHVTLMSHEAAHQWWGNLLTSRDWRHFWLNEGFATFMAAAYVEHRYGAAAYARQIDAWRRRVERLRAEGKDRPLVYPDWNSPTADDRAVVYQKGAYFLHLLRQELGDRAFWRGVRQYTRGRAGQSVVTKDFETAMEKASGRNLTEFFRKWVFGS
jgi:aminopeptidase N